MPSNNTYEFFKYVVIIQIFFGISASIIGYSIPNPDYIEIVQPAGFSDHKDISDSLQSSVDTSIQLPFIDVAFMIFNTGNIVLNLLINSIFAIPSMCTVIVTVFTMFIPVDPVLANYLSVFVWTIAAVIYILGIIALILSLRSGSVQSVA